MDAPSNPSDSTADKIRAINSIDEAVPKLLSSASTAISALSSKSPFQDPHDPSTSSNSSSDLERHREVFATSTTTYFTLVHKIEQELKQQASLIERALSQSAVEADTTDQNIADGKGPQPSKDGIESSGLGSLDVGVLKSRVHGGELDIESKIWAEARSMLEHQGGTRKD